MAVVEAEVATMEGILMAEGPDNSTRSEMWLKMMEKVAGRRISVKLPASNVVTVVISPMHAQIRTDQAIEVEQKGGLVEGREEVVDPTKVCL